MDNLFGPTPWETQQGMNQQINQAADSYAKLDPFQRAAAGMHRAGGMLAGPVAGMLGMENPAAMQAKRTEQIMGQGQADLTSSKGLLAKAEQFRQAGDIRTATALFMKGQELARQEQAAALAQQKQDFQEKDLLAERIAKRQQDLAIAMQASDDRRYGIEAQAAAQREAIAARRDIAAMMAATKGAAGLTPAQKAKQQALAGKSSAMIRGMGTDFASLQEEAKAIKDSKGLGGATGVTGMLPSYPGGEAAQVEAKLDGFKSRVKNIGLQIARQGGGIGQITEKEWGIIEGMVANIDPVKLGKKGTQDAIDQVIAKAKATLDNAKLQHAESFADMTEQAAPPAASAGNGWAIRPKGK